MKVYLLLQEQEVCVQGYEVDIESYVLGAYSTRLKAAQVARDHDDGDPNVNYRIIEREVQ